MVRGVYQFFRASENPTAQANLLLNAIGTLGADDLPPSRTWRSWTASPAPRSRKPRHVGLRHPRRDGARAHHLLRRGLLGSPPQHRPVRERRAPVGRQLAGELPPTAPTPWTGWTMWQYADNGSVPGISGAVDLDRFNGTVTQLQQTAGGSPDYAAAYVSQSFPLATTALQMTEGQTIPSYIELKTSDRRRGTRTPISARPSRAIARASSPTRAGCRPTVPRA